jgi:DNA-binding transcriptional LysR family regulator
LDLEARPYRYFVAIAEKGSFRAAADHLNVSQPALSAQVRELERRLGFALFKRTSRHVELTVEGALFLGNARRIIMETEFINRAARDIRTNPLRVGTAHFTNLIPERVRLVEAFLRDHPEVPLTVSGHAHGQLYAALRERAIDVAVTLEPQVDGEDSAVEEQGAEAGFERIHLGRRLLRMLVPAEDAWVASDPLPVVALRDRDVCTITRAHGIMMTETVARLFNAIGARLVRPPEGDAVAAMRYAALRRLPVIDLGWFPVPGDVAGGLVSRRVAGWDIGVDLVAIRSIQGRHPALDPFWRVAAAIAES